MFLLLQRVPLENIDLLSAKLTQQVEEMTTAEVLEGRDPSLLGVANPNCNPYRSS